MAYSGCCAYRGADFGNRDPGTLSGNIPFSKVKYQILETETVLHWLDMRFSKEYKKYTEDDFSAINPLQKLNPTYDISQVGFCCDVSFFLPLENTISGAIIDLHQYVSRE